jgi:hypothetical protein
MGKRKAAAGKHTVYEAGNARHREVYVGSTTQPMHALSARFAQRLPRGLGHWSAQDAMTFRSLEFGLSSAAAAAFIRSYTPRREGWRVVRQAARGRSSR